jgi:ABC-type branched-subunit amino acid transport system substrate-binding protein
VLDKAQHLGHDNCDHSFQQARPARCRPATTVQNKEESASETRSFSRSTVIEGAAAVGISFPYISYGQSDVIRIGHLTPRTGFLGPLGEFAVQAMDMAVAEINDAGGVNGRKIELLKEDSVNPQTRRPRPSAWSSATRSPASSAKYRRRRH